MTCICTLQHPPAQVPSASVVCSGVTNQGSGLRGVLGFRLDGYAILMVLRFSLRVRSPNVKQTRSPEASTSSGGDEADPTKISRLHEIPINPSETLYKTLRENETFQIFMRLRAKLRAPQVVAVKRLNFDSPRLRLG